MENLIKKKQGNAKENDSFKNLSSEINILDKKQLKDLKGGDGETGLDAPLK